MPHGCIELQESVLPLSGNQFLVLNHQSGFNRLQNCIYWPSSEVSLPQETQTITLEPGCHLLLIDHVLFTDSTIHLSKDYHSYKWDWDTEYVKTFILNDSFIAEINAVSTAHHGLLSLTDLIQTSATQCNRQLLWTLINSVLFTTEALGIVVIIYIYCSFIYNTCIFEGLNKVYHRIPTNALTQCIPSIFRCILISTTSSNCSAFTTLEPSCSL